MFIKWQILCNRKSDHVGIPCDDLQHMREFLNCHLTAARTIANQFGIGKKMCIRDRDRAADKKLDSGNTHRAWLPLPIARLDGTDG